MENIENEKLKKTIMAQSSDALDFSAFDLPVTGEDILKYITSRKLALFVLKFVVLPVTVVTLYIVLGGVTSFIVVYILGLVVAATIAGAFYLKSIRRVVRLEKFALSNNIGFARHQPVNGLLGMIFNEGTLRYISEALLFRDGVEIGNYQCKIDSGRGSTIRRWSYMRIKLDKPLPHIVLDRRSNDTLGMISNLPSGFRRDQLVRLEGDFNEHFTVYVPSDYQTDARYVLTPDVMAVLIDYGQGYDIEIIDDELFFYGRSRPIDDEEIKSRLNAASAIASELRHQTRNYADERVEPGSQGTAVAESGQRLKPGLRPITIVMIIVVVYMLASVIFNVVGPLFFRRF